MARLSTAYFCTECGSETPRWQGQCPVCHAWNTLVEEPGTRSRAKSARSAPRAGAAPKAEAVLLREIAPESAKRCSTGLAELDFVLGGGVVSGSLVLLGGEPGIGKSTLLLQVAGNL